MILLVGLGNVDKRYESTRHNVGFMVLDRLAKYYKSHWSAKAKFKSELAEILVDSKKLLLLKPSTYMNLSGQSVVSICSYNKITAQNICVIHDDLDLPIGKLKYKFGGGSGGHNGLKSIDSHIGSNYHRIRVGIDRPKNDRDDVSDYVLSPFSSKERELIDYSIETIVRNVGLLFSEQLDLFKREIYS